MLASESQLPVSPADPSLKVESYSDPVRPAIIVAGVLVLLLYASLGIKGTLPWLSGRLPDPDCYMRLVRVAQLWDSGNWNASREPRISPPEGLVQHWTRPLDILVLVPSLAANRWFLDRKTSLLFSAMIEPVLGLLLLIPVCVWAFKPLVLPQDRWLLPFLLVTQPAVFYAFQPGRADNPFFSAFLFAGYVGLLLRLGNSESGPWTAFFCGVVSALAIWHTTESSVFVLLGFVWLGLEWVLYGHPKLKNLLLFSASVVFSQFSFFSSNARLRNSLCWRETGYPSFRFCSWQ